MRKIAMVGTAGSGTEAPYDDPSWEIWGVGSRMQYVTRANRWFEVHRLEGEPGEWAKQWREQIKSYSEELDLYMHYPETELGPKVIQYPVNRITLRFGTYFMTSSFSWMMALAIDELQPVDGPKTEGEIAIYGVDMEYGTEYRNQRGGFRHFIDLARFLDIPITILGSSGLAYEPVPYPMWQDDPLLNKVNFRNELTKRQLADRDKSLQHTRTLIAQDRALLSEFKQMTNGYDKEKRTNEVELELDSLLTASENLSREITLAQGAFETECWLKDYLTTS